MTYREFRIMLSILFANGEIKMPWKDSYMRLDGRGPGYWIQKLFLNHKHILVRSYYNTQYKEHFVRLLPLTDIGRHKLVKQGTNWTRLS